MEMELLRHVVIQHEFLHLYFLVDDVAEKNFGFSSRHMSSYCCFVFFFFLPLRVLVSTTSQVIRNSSVSTVVAVVVSLH